jgi:hypothetical protein
VISTATGDLTTSGYLVAVVRLAAMGIPLFLAARAWRRRLAPEWERSLAILADLVGLLALAVILGEGLGSIGEFRRGPFIGASIVIAAVSIARDRRRPERPRPEQAVPSRLPAATTVVVAAASCALVFAQWSTWVAHDVTLGIGNAGGPGNGDSLWYHMPIAASFVQSGWTTHLAFLNGEALVTYYPANTSLLHAIGILAMRTDVLSPFVNIALLPVALLAGWCIGARRGVGAATLAAVAVACTIPVVVVSEAGTAKDDVLGLVGLLAAIAFLECGRGTRAAAIYGGLGAGLAIGSKLTFVAPVLVLAVTLVVVTPKASRRSTSIRWLTGAFATGSYWYLRNLFSIGNPIPGLNFGIGRILPRPPTPSMDDFGTNVLHNLTNGRVWHEGLIPGLQLGFGSAWVVPLTIVTAATFVGLVKLRGTERVVPIVGLLAFLAFLITPGTVWAPQLIAFPGVRFVTASLFAFNLRYMLPAVAIGLVTVPLVAERWRRGPYVATAAIGVALASMQVVPQGRESWSRGHVLLESGVALFALALVAAVVSGRRPPWLVAGGKTRLAWAGAAAAAAAALLVAGRAVGTYSAVNRYGGLDLARWASSLPGARIGYSGFVFSYPLYGDFLQNHVQMIGEHGPNGAWHPVRTCPAWRRDVRRADIQYLVVPLGGPAPGLGIDLSRWRVGLPGGEPPDEPPESSWTRTDPGMRLIFRSTEGAGVYAVTGRATARGCPRTAD